jgi:hypothetical protein
MRRIEAHASSMRPAAGKAIPIREFTVRMSDGSSRVFREEGAVGWRLGTPDLHRRRERA